MATSEDGFISDLNGGVDWLPQIDIDPETLRNYTSYFDSVDAILMGRVSFDQLLSFGQWPYGDKPCFVLTTTKR